MSAAPPSPKRSRLSIASATLATIPLLAFGMRLALAELAVISSSSITGNILSSTFELSLLCVPLALPIGLAALWRHAGGPSRPGIGLALLGTLLSGAELVLLFMIANAEF